MPSDREAGKHRRPSLHVLLGCVDSRLKREGGRKRKPQHGKVSIGADRPAAPFDGLIISAEKQLRESDPAEPLVGAPIAGTQSKGLGDMTLRWPGPGIFSPRRYPRARPPDWD